MKRKTTLNSKTESVIDELVNHYIENRASFQTLVEGLAKDFVTNPKVAPFVHSIKFRTKDPESLRGKLRRKAVEALKKRRVFSITTKNLFIQITDLAGIRILHLYPKQMSEMKPHLEALLAERRLMTKERIAYTWDEEYRHLFQNLGYVTKYKPSMYTSLHHVVVANRTHKFHCEIQIRTLMEEVWGEVDHTINYPEASGSVACREQLKALARMSSAGTRLVDSIFESHNDYLKKKQR